MQLFSQSAEIIMAFRVNELDPLLSHLNFEASTLFNIEMGVTINMHARINCFDDLNLHTRGTWNNNRPIRQRMRTDWHQKDTVNVR